MAHGRRRFGQLDLPGGGMDGALQVAGLAAQPCQFQAQPAALGAVLGLQALQLGGAAPGRIQRLEFARERGARFQDQGDPEQRLAALDDKGVVSRAGSGRVAWAGLRRT